MPFDKKNQTNIKTWVSYASDQKLVLLKDYFDSPGTSDACWIGVQTVAFDFNASVLSGSGRHTKPQKRQMTPWIHPINRVGCVIGIWSMGFQGILICSVRSCTARKRERTVIHTIVIGLTNDFIS